MSEVHCEGFPCLLVFLPDFSLMILLAYVCLCVRLSPRRHKYKIFYNDTLYRYEKSYKCRPWYVIKLSNQIFVFHRDVYQNEEL